MDQIKSKNEFLVPLVTLTILFFMWGFITCLNDMLIPYFKSVFELTHFESNLVQLAFFFAYFLISLIYFIISATVGDPIRKIGYKTTIIAGLLISATACFIFFWEAGVAQPKFFVFLSALFLLGSGFTFLQIAANPLVSILGTPETSSSRLNLSNGFNALGTTLAPVIGGTVIFTYFHSEEQSGASAVQMPYLCLASILLVLAAIIFFSSVPDMKSADAENEESKAGALKYPHLVFGMLGIFFYVGGEVTIGSNLVSYMKECVDGIADESTAGKFLSFYWGGAMIGRFAGSIYMSEMEKNKKLIYMALTALVMFALIFSITCPDFRNADAWQWWLGEVSFFLIFLVVNYVAFIYAKSVPSRTLGLFACINIALIIAMLLTEGRVSLWCILAVGLFNSIMFSNIFTLAIKGLGKYTSQGSSLLVMMILGGAVMPPIQGALADCESIGVHMAFFLPIICYAYLAWYGFVGSSIRRKDIVEQ